MAGHAVIRIPLALLFAVLCLAVAAPASASPRGKGVLIAHEGTWTFAKLGLPTIVVTPGSDGRGEVLVRNAFQLPKGVRQGPVKWFRVQLHYEVDIAPDTGPGEIYFTADTDGIDGTSAQIIFSVRRLPSGEMAVTSSELGDVNGNVIRHGRQQVWRGEFENLMPYGGIRAGVNSFAVQLVHLRGDAARPARAVVYPDSAIVYGRIIPAHLGVHLHAPSSAEVGQHVPVKVTVTNLGKHRTSAGSFGIGVIPGNASRTPSLGALVPLDAGRSQTATFYVTPNRAGKFRVVAGAQAGRSNDPRAYVTLRVRARPSSGFPWWWIPLGVGAVALAGVIARVLLRRRATTA